jgi:hypothetical protein
LERERLVDDVAIKAEVDGGAEEPGVGNDLIFQG